MQDRAISKIGNWQLKVNKDYEEVDLYIENMFPGKNYQMILLIFDLIEENNQWSCEYAGIDIEQVGSSDHYMKYAYRKGAARGGDITFTTKLSSPVEKKITTIQNNVFKRILKSKAKDKFYFELIKSTFDSNIEIISTEIDSLFLNFDKIQSVTTGLSFMIRVNTESKYLRDFESIAETILISGSETKYTHAGTESKGKNSVCSVTGNVEKNIFGFAAPFKYSSPDKPGFISGFFNKKENWKNYPISDKEALALEIGKKYIKENLTGYFYGHNFMFVPHPLIDSDKNMEEIINLLINAFQDEKISRANKQRAEDRVQKLIAREDNYFNLDMLFYKEDTKTGAISINLMLEEILPSRFRQLFIDVPKKIQSNVLFEKAMTINKELVDLKFTFGILKSFFESDFLSVTQKLFMGDKISQQYIFEQVSKLIRKNYNDRLTGKLAEPVNWTVKKGIMLLYYLQELNIINYDKTFTYMENETTDKVQTKKKSFDLSKFNEFIQTNQGFLDSNIKIGVFSVGILVKLLLDKQQVEFSNTPFEKKLKGYKLNHADFNTIYLEALKKLQQHYDHYVYSELREIVAKYFICNIHELPKYTNTELSFYFVAGIELGKQFKTMEIKVTE